MICKSQLSFLLSYLAGKHCMFRSRDQLGRIITLPDYPRRIISLVPSQTELLSELQLSNEVVGITKFCVRPDQWFKTKTRIGGTKRLNLQKIDTLRPDLVIANKEENVKEQIDAIAEKYPVWVSDVCDLNSAIDMVGSIAATTDRIERGRNIVAQIEKNFEDLSLSVAQQEKRPRAAYLIWKDPYMTVGGDTFIHSMLVAAGFENVFQQMTRYPQIRVEDIMTTNCDVLLLSSEPFPFREPHVEDLQAQLPSTRILLVDGEMFSWYGSRLLHSPAYFHDLRSRLCD